MSAPDPMNWKVISEEQWDSMMDKYGYHKGGEAIEKVAYSVARRRAIEELKALSGMFCVHCAAGVEFVRLRDEIGKWDGHAHNPSDLVDCDALHIRDRIAAIEAEEA